jgi:hypothetical protein
LPSFRRERDDVAPLAMGVAVGLSTVGPFAQGLVFRIMSRRETMKEAVQRIASVVPFITALAEEASQAKMPYRDVARLLQAAMKGAAKKARR